jgi:hypothetical protein
MHWLTNVKYIENYFLELEFNDGTIKKINFDKFIGGNGVFQPLKNIDYFKTVKIDDAGNTICWDNGADFCPDTLYEISND